MPTSPASRYSCRRPPNCTRLRHEPSRCRLPTPLPAEPALFLAETVDELNEGANFLAGSSRADWEVLRREGTEISIEVGGSVFFQGDEHKGIWLIEEGKVRTYYAAPSGRQITLAYWTAGHFVGGPEIFGGGEHIWSADVTQTAACSICRPACCAS